ncbi:MAG: D-alanyl-D-alanine carboxypeptidase [Lachnospiraceae bacterium]|nr:D-alanyl-D-alanine carboxypeptidase [Lachnospiraceae bacterium]
MNLKKIIVIILSAVLAFGFVLPVHATRNNSNGEISEDETAIDEAQLRAAIPIETNEIEGWPDGPVCYAQSAIVMEASTGTIIYEKNSHEQLYPASITKIMTSLLAVENASLSDTVTFSHNSVFGIPAGSSIVGGIDEDDQYSMEFCLYGLMLLSGNETAIAIAEHVAGSTDAFADLMNQKAAEVGCLNTHFVNPHGLHDPDHYTSAYDMAMITKYAIQNPDFKRFICTATYDFPPTSKGEIRYDKRNHHKMMEGGVYEYPGCIGGKTGYTSDAGQTLVTLAERDGMTLICVVLKETKPDHWTDSATLLDYGFQNFQKLNISENEENFSIDNANFFHTDSNIFGNTNPLIEINKSGSIIIPKNSVFTDSTPALNFDKADEAHNIVASLDYSFFGHFVGYTTLDLMTGTSDNFNFAANSSDLNDGENLVMNTENGEITVKAAKDNNISKIIIFLLIGIIILVLLVVITLFALKKFQVASNKDYVGKKIKNKKKRSKPKKYPSKYDNLKF